MSADTGSELENVCTEAVLLPSETTLNRGSPLRLEAQKVSLSDENQEPDDVLSYWIWKSVLYAFILSARAGGRGAWVNAVGGRRAEHGRVRPRVLAVHGAHACWVDARTVEIEQVGVGVVADC